MFFSIASQHKMGCNNEEQWSEGDSTMLTPYVNDSEIVAINEAFSTDDSGPWGL